MSDSYFSNRYARLLLGGFEEVLGNTGLEAILSLADLAEWIQNIPADDLERELNFSRQAAIHRALIQFYGPRGGRGVAQRAGRVFFTRLLRDYREMLGANELSFKILPPHAKLRIVLNNLFKSFFEISDLQGELIERDGVFILNFYRCPECWGLLGEDRPTCYFFVGILEEVVRWIGGGCEGCVTETRCVAMGHENCEFQIQKIKIS